MSSSQPPKKDESAQAGPSTTAAATDKAAAEAGKKKLPQLGALEDDDEFEVSPRDFPACPPWHRGVILRMLTLQEWNADCECLCGLSPLYR